MDFSSFASALDAIIARAVATIPAALELVGLLLLGWALAAAGRFAVRKVARTATDAVERRFPQFGALGQSGLRRTVPRVIGWLVYWLVLLSFAAEAVKRLPLPLVTESLRSAALFLPKVLLAVTVLVVGLAVARFVQHWTAGIAGRAGVEHAPALGRMAQVSVIFVALVIAAQQVEFASEVLASLLSILLATTLGGMALAFGLGSGPLVTNIMASYYASKAFRTGDAVRIAGIEGTLREILPTSIVLDVDQDRVHVPARKYCDDVSTVVGRGQ